MNLQRLDLASIRLVVLCAESGSLSEAARRCHLSLPGASHRLKAFEDAMGEPVFQRHRRGLRITTRGRHVVYCGIELLRWVDRLAEPAPHDGAPPPISHHTRPSC
jgi:DNA-binding transcriptional LysR family regulator